MEGFPLVPSKAELKGLLFIAECDLLLTYRTSTHVRAEEACRCLAIIIKTS